jgi:hypothetical protein
VKTLMKFRVSLKAVHFLTEIILVFQEGPRCIGSLLVRIARLFLSAYSCILVRTPRRAPTCSEAKHFTRFSILEEEISISTLTQNFAFRFYSQPVRICLKSILILSANFSLYLPVVLYAFLVYFASSTHAPFPDGSGLSIQNVGITGFFNFVHRPVF